MRFVLCDEDLQYTSMIEDMLRDHAHELVGMATTTADSVALLQVARPEVAIVDISLGFNSDYDVVEAATAVGATTIVFSQRADDADLSRYEVRPTVVYKPDLTKLEFIIGRLGLDTEHKATNRERRTREGRAAAGPVPTGVADAQAFYAAVDGATAGDALIAIGLASPDPAGQIASDMAAKVEPVLRGGDRLLMSATGVRVFLPAGGGHGVASLHTRLIAAGALPEGATVRSVVIVPGETPLDAFDRLKTVQPR